MSHYKIRSIQVAADGKTTVEAAANNVYPRTYSVSPMDYRSESNPFTGKLAAEAEILAAYEEGSFQGGSNKFTRALAKLTNMPEYKDFDWRGNWKASQDARQNNRRGYFELLSKVL